MKKSGLTKLNLKQRNVDTDGNIADGDKEKIMKDTPVYIYLNREQCDQFNVGYFGESTFQATGEEILESRPHGYDRFHQSVLKPLRYDLLTFVKTESDNPGWYLLAGYNRSDFGV